MLARVVEQPDPGEVDPDPRPGDLGQPVEHFDQIERGGEEPARLGQDLELARPLIDVFAHQSRLNLNDFDLNHFESTVEPRRASALIGAASSLSQPTSRL